jgi:hypothetical protein
MKVNLKLLLHLHQLPVIVKLKVLQNQNHYLVVDLQVEYFLFLRHE